MAIEAGRRASTENNVSKFGVGRTEHCLTIGPRLAGRRRQAWLALLASRRRVHQLGRGWSIISGRSLSAITDNTDSSENRHKTGMIVNSPSQLSIRMGKMTSCAVRCG